VATRQGRNLHGFPLDHHAGRFAGGAMSKDHEDLAKHFVPGSFLIERWGHPTTIEFVSLLLIGDLQPHDPSGAPLDPSDLKINALNTLRRALDSMQRLYMGEVQGDKPEEGGIAKGDWTDLSFQQVCHEVEGIIMQCSLPYRSTFREHVEGLEECRYLTADVEELEGKYPALVANKDHLYGEAQEQNQTAQPKGPELSLRELAEEVRHEADTLYRAILRDLHDNGITITTASMQEIHDSLNEVLPELKLHHLRKTLIQPPSCALRKNNPRKDFIEKMIQLVAMKCGHKITLDQVKELFGDQK